VLTGRTVTWSSSSPNAATISASGLATSVAAGTTTITATSGTVSGTTTLTVTAAPPAPPPSGLYANQPAGYTRIAETNDTALPWNGVLGGTVANYGSGPSTLLSLVSGGNLPVSFPTGQTTAQQFIWEAGTHAGDQEAGSDGAGYWLWDNITTSGANGGPAGNEYSAVYLSQWICLYGNGTNMEVPGAGLVKLNLFGSTNNNQNGSGPGPTELVPQAVAVATSSGAGGPNTATQFYLQLATQNGTNINYPPNVNTTTYLNVGQVHHVEQVYTLGTAGGSNGTWDAWIDGVHISHYTNIPFINSAYAANGGDGLAGFWGWDFAPWWGGQGGPNKSRDDAIYLGHTYMSGIFLRNRQ
jgi:hypothetical protein